MTIFYTFIFWRMEMTANTRREFLKQAAIGAAALAAYPPPAVLGTNYPLLMSGCVALLRPQTWR